MRTLLCCVALIASGCIRAEADPPDYSTLQLHGDGMTHGSLALAVQAAGRLLGSEYDYEAVQCLLGNAFAPAIDLDETCRSWWHCEAAMQDRAMASAARRLGLIAKRIPTPPLRGHPDTEADRTVQRQACLAGIRSAMGRGAVVIAEGYWRGDGPDGLVPWVWAGIVTEARDDGTILGACLNSRKDNPINVMAGMWAVSRAAPSAAVARPDIETLRNAVARIRGAGPFKSDARHRFGLAAMDAWIKQMRECPGFCAECQQRSQNGWTCARDNGAATIENSRVAARYLRRVASGCSPSAAGSLEDAAGHYDRIVGLLTPTLTGQGGPLYSDFVGDIGRQRNHADDVLVPVRSELAAAADLIERAVRQTASRANRGE